jgi:hypothetical protein
VERHQVARKLDDVIDARPGREVVSHREPRPPLRDVDPTHGGDQSPARAGLLIEEALADQRQRMIPAAWNVYHDIRRPPRV